MKQALLFTALLALVWSTHFLVLFNSCLRMEPVCGLWEHDQVSRLYYEHYSSWFRRRLLLRPDVVIWSSFVRTGYCWLGSALANLGLEPVSTQHQSSLSTCRRLLHSMNYHIVLILLFSFESISYAPCQ